MQCPCCEDSTLIKVTYEHVEVDKCPQCFGVWLDEGELEKIVECRDKKVSSVLMKETIGHSFLGIPKHERGKDLHCPHCQKTLIAINYSLSSGVILDRCPDGHGMWFDQTELEKVQVFREYWKDQMELKEDSLLRLVKDQEVHNRPKKRFYSLLFSLSEFFGGR